MIIPASSEAMYAVVLKHDHLYLIWSYDFLFSHGGDWDTKHSKT